MPTPIKIERYGWRKDSLDNRDHWLELRAATLLPLHVDLRQTSYMPPVYNQGNLGCHDDKTQVLTEKGWVDWASYDGKSLLGTMHPNTHRLEFQNPTALQVFDYDGEMFKIDHSSLDFSLTPNHRMFVRRFIQSKRTLSGEFSFHNIDSLGWYTGLPATTSGWIGAGLDKLTIGNRTYFGDDFIALVALIASDGWVGGTESNWNTISFCCFREDRKGMVASLAARLGISEVPSRPGVWKWSDPDLAEWLRINLFVSKQPLRSPFKRVPDIIKCASQAQVTRFLDFFGDQHVGASGRQFYTASHRMCDDLQELLLKVGKRCGLYERPARDVTMKDGRKISSENCSADITITEWQSNQLSIERKRQIKTDRYKGPVFCATVPNGLLITRRNGSVLISGNSCTANALGAAFQYDRRKLHQLPDFIPSRLMIYYMERELEGSISIDSGAEIRDGIKALASSGVCSEQFWPYIPTQFAKKPTQNAYTEAAKHQIIQYARVVQSVSAMKACLAAGFPFTFGFTVYESFESKEVAHSGMVPMPGPDEQPIGGHAVMAVGYTSKNRFIVRNSWGSQWGDSGYFYMPFDYVNDPSRSSDMWMITTTES